LFELFAAYVTWFPSVLPVGLSLTIPWDFLSQNLFYQIFESNSLRSFLKQVHNMNTFSSLSVFGVKLSNLENIFKMTTLWSIV